MADGSKVFHSTVPCSFRTVVTISSCCQFDLRNTEKRISAQNSSSPLIQIRCCIQTWSETYFEVPIWLLNLFVSNLADRFCKHGFPTHCGRHSKLVHGWPNWTLCAWALRWCEAVMPLFALPLMVFKGSLQQVCFQPALLLGRWCMQPALLWLGPGILQHGNSGPDEGFGQQNEKRGNRQWHLQKLQRAPLENWLTFRLTVEELLQWKKVKGRNAYSFSATVTGCGL